jgi:hypothetical protein
MTQKEQIDGLAKAHMSDEFKKMAAQATRSPADKPANIHRIADIHNATGDAGLNDRPDKLTVDQ